MNSGSGSASASSSSGSPEDLMDMLASMVSTGGMQGTVSSVQTSLNTEDNEMVVQSMLTAFRHFISIPAIRPLLDTNTAELCQAVNLGMIITGYMMHARDVTRDELAETVYYAKLTQQGDLLRSQYHPIRLREIMVEHGLAVPPSFQLLYSNQDYLPNVVSVWDRGERDSVSLISFQKVNVHTRPAGV